MSDHEHQFYPHDHRHKPAGMGQCSGKFWCVICKEWLVGEKCTFKKSKG